MSSASAIHALLTLPKNSASRFNSPTSSATSTTTMPWAASTSPGKTSSVTAYRLSISVAAKPRSASANSSASRPTALGNATNKARSCSAWSIPKAAPRSGFWPIPTAPCWRASSPWILRCSESACVFRAPKKCYSSPMPVLGAWRKRISLKSVIVIGGGLAGLAAGVALAEAGCQVRLFKQRPFLGGRATSYVLPDGEHVDNCQHVTLGCCTNLDDFYRRVGAAGKIKFFDRLLFLDPQGRRGEMQAGLLPAPFHMTGSFAKFAPLTLKDKLSIAWAMLNILQTNGRTWDVDQFGGISMLEWLRRRHQTKGAIERFWRVVLVSALDEELDKTDARYGIDVFW